MVDPRRWSPRDLTLEEVVAAAAKYYPDQAPLDRITEGDLRFYPESPNLVDALVWKIHNILGDGGETRGAIRDIIESIDADIEELRAAQKGLRELLAPMRRRR